MSDSNFDGVLDPDAGWPDIPQASTQFVVLGGQGGPLNEQAKALAARTKKLKSDMEAMGNISEAGFGGQYKNLVVNVSGVGYQGSITADRIIVESIDFKIKILRNVNIAFNGANLGINGIDAGSITAGNFYYLYVIYNESTDTTSSLMSLSASSPSLPSGYSNFALVGAALFLSGAGFVASRQIDNYLSYLQEQFLPIHIGGELNTSLPPTVKSLNLITPSIAKQIDIMFAASGGDVKICVKASATAYMTSNAAGVGFSQAIVPLHTNNLYIAASSGYAEVYANGYYI